jgi:hypothetical protein
VVVLCEDGDGQDFGNVSRVFIFEIVNNTACSALNYYSKLSMSDFSLVSMVKKKTK